METPKTNNEALMEGAKQAEKWFNEISIAMAQSYNKQLNLAASFYSNFFNPVLKNNKGLENMGLSDMIFNSDLTKWFSMPLNSSDGSPSKPMPSSFDKLYKQMNDYTRTLFTGLNRGMEGKETDWTEVSKEYKETIDKRMEASRKTFNAIAEAYGKQLDFSIETNKKMMEDISRQFDSVIDQNQKFWTDTLNTNQVPLNKEEKKITEQSPAEIKKRTNIPVMA